MLTTKTTYKDLGWRKFAAAAKAEPNGSRFVEVGFDNPAVVDRAGYNEFGSSRVPARSFIRAPLYANSAEINVARLMIAQALATGSGKATFLLNALGERAVSWVRGAIDHHIPPPNAQSTVDKKGFDHPLIETNALYNAISYRIVNRK